MRADADTAIAADRLLELSEKMFDAVEAGDRTSARAMWQIMLKELNQLVRNETGSPARFRVAKERLASVTDPLNLADTADAALEFWLGFMDGIEENTLKGAIGKAYMAGYTAGSLKAP